MRVVAGTEPQRQPEVSYLPAANPHDWPWAQRVGFRFLFAYFLLYVFPYPVGSLGAGQIATRSSRSFWFPIVSWVGTHLLGLPGPIKQLANGSGDQVFDYVLLLCIAVVAAVATIAWSWLDRNVTNYDRLHQWFRLFLRISLGSALLLYGADKIFRMQFPEPALSTLVETFGQSSPMGLLWTFMGTSRAYSLFGGVAELVAGALLFVPGLTLLGSLLGFAVLSNVLLLNLCYDVPRKIVTLHLLAMCALLALPDVKRLLNLFIFNRTVQPARTVPLFDDKRLNQGILVLQLGLGVLFLGVYLHSGYADQQKTENARLPGTLRGIWSVQEFALDGAQRPPMPNDKERWGRVVFDDSQQLVVQTTDGTPVSYRLHLNQDGRSLTLAKGGDPYFLAAFTFEQPQADVLILDGRFEGQQLRASLRRVDQSDANRFLLLNRGFHWVTPYPVIR